VDPGKNASGAANHRAWPLAIKLHDFELEAAADRLEIENNKNNKN
jgi:hypothetical protein